MITLLFINKKMQDSINDSTLFHLADIHENMLCKLRLSPQKEIVRKEN